MVNSVESGQTPLSTASNLELHYLLRSFSRGLGIIGVYWLSVSVLRRHFIRLFVFFLTSRTYSVKDQGPVVQSVVSLTSLLRVISLTVLADSIHNILIFFAEKMWVAFALQKLLTFFQQKFQYICVSLDVNFNESLTNDIVSFEQLGPEEFCYRML